MPSFWKASRKTLILKNKTENNNQIGKDNISRFPIFAGLSLEQQQRVAQIIAHKNFDAGEEIAKEGEQGDELFLLLAGEVEVSKSLTLLVESENMDKKDKSLVHLKAEFAPYFGEMAILKRDSKRSATVKTVKECRVGVIKRKDLIQLCESDKELGYLILLNIAKHLAENLTKANQDILKLTTAFSIALQN